MSKIKQNLVFFMEPSDDACYTTVQAATMMLNLFCIDEDAAFELSGVNYLKTPFAYLSSRQKGKEYSILRSNFYLTNLIFINNG